MLLNRQPLDEIMATQPEFSIEETDSINSDDSYSSSSFTCSDIDESDDFDFGRPLHPFASGAAAGVKRVKILDPVTDKLQSFIDSGVLSTDSMFYGLLANSVNYVQWLNERQNNRSAQFKWDSEVLQFVESLEYHGGRKVVNLLRGEGHVGEGGGGMFTFDWKKWNWPLPGKTTGDKQYEGHSTENGLRASLLESFILSCITEETLPLYEDENVRVVPAVLAKDGMQLKPGLLFDPRQGKLVGSTLDIDYKFVKNNPLPDKEMLKNSIVQEAEVSCLTTIDSKISMEVGVRHGPCKGFKFN